LEKQLISSEEALERLKAYLESRKMKCTQQRQLITEIFFDPVRCREHPSVEELYLWVRERDSSVGQATVYRTLKLLVESGLATAHQLDNNQTRYEPCVPGEHHDHLVCVRCGGIVEFHDERIEALQEAIAQAHGLRLVGHKLVLYGSPDGACKSCTACKKLEAEG